MLLTANKKFITKYHEWFYTKPYSQTTLNEEFYTADEYIQEQYGIDWIRITPESLYVASMGTFANDTDATHFSDYYGAYIDTPSIPPTPKRKYESYDIYQTESMTIALDYYDDIEITVPVVSFNYDLMNNDTQYNLIQFNNFIKSGAELFTSQSTEYYYKIKEIDGYDWKHIAREKYTAEITFTCSPFKYKADESLIVLDNISGSGTMTRTFNLTWGNTNSFPIFELYTSLTNEQNATVTINGESFSFTGINAAPLHVDCETCEVYRVTTSGQKSLKYGSMGTGYPAAQLKIGSNAVSVSAGVRLTLKPRERFI